MPLMLREAEPSDCRLLYEWRNDPLVRQFSFHTEPVLWENHERWFEAMMKDPDRRQYILERDGKPVGQIRITKEGADAEISYSVAEDERGKGYGSALLKMILPAALKAFPDVSHLTGQVKAGNKASAGAFEKCGYHSDGALEDGAFRYSILLHRQDNNDKRENSMGFRDLKFDPETVFLVTGGAGFIGSNICEAILDMGLTVRCLDNLSTGHIENIEPFMDNDRFTFLRQDIRDLDACMEATKGVDFVLNEAAWGSVPRSIEMPLLYEEINIRGTLNMMEAARQNGVRKFVYASSSSVYGDSAILPKKEGQEGKLLSPYALTKRTDEEYGHLYHTLYGLDTYGLRYFNVFGRRQDPNGAYAAVIPKWLKLLLHDERPTINGDGRQSRDFTYIDNVIEANLKACLAPSEAAGEAFNIGAGGRVFLIDVYHDLCSVLGKDIEPIFGPPRKGDIRDSNADISKARQLLGYDPSYDFRAGMELAIAWYRENLR